MIKIEKNKAIGLILKIEKALEIWRKKRSTVLLLIILSIMAIFFINSRRDSTASSSTKSDVNTVLSGEKADISADAQPEGKAEIANFAKIFSGLGGSRALALLGMNSEEARTSATLKVPAEFGTIQEAIDAAVSGDTVYVAAGEYKEIITMKNGVSLIGEKAETTILDGDKKGNVVTFKGLDDKDMRLENFSIKNAQENLSGVLIENSSPVINRNIIFSNDYDVYIKGQSSPTVQRNILEQSKAGVQIFNLNEVNNSNPIIVDNLIYGNKKGVNLYNGNATIEHNTISFNSAYGIESGATFGINLVNSSAVIKNNIVSDNGICEICSGIAVDAKSKNVEIRYNDLWNNQLNFVCFGECVMDETNRSEDPFFENGLLYNFNLRPDSLFLSAGSDGQRLGARL